MKKFFCVISLILPVVIVCAVLAGVATIKITYPMAYSAEISKYSKAYELDESLVYAVIKEESGFNTLAKSRAGAMGLMQIMPATATWIAKDLEIENFSYELLYNPRVNIEMGCYYLNYLFSKYGNIHKVLFAYNAGEGVMNKTYSPDEPLIIETVEIIETREYIAGCLKSQKVYDKLKASFRVT